MSGTNSSLSGIHKPIGTGQHMNRLSKTKLTNPNDLNLINNNDNNNNENQFNRLSLLDPGSIIDGRSTFFEIYSGRSISQFVYPCIGVRRFCDETVGLPNPSKTDNTARDFFIRYPRMILRIGMATMQFHPEINENSEDKRTLRTVEEQGVIIPKFTFIITSLMKIPDKTNPECEKDWQACDAEVCVPKSLWCDNVHNCPQWQDEGPQCQKIENEHHQKDKVKSSYELRKEQEEREAEAERLIAQQLHLSILSSLGLLLIIVTATCVILTLRRRKKEQTRQMSEKIEITASDFDQPSYPLVKRLNHVMSDSHLHDSNSAHHQKRSDTDAKPTFTLSNSSSLQEGAELQKQQTIINQKTSGSGTAAIWNSTDSINAPLLWQRQPNTSDKKHSKTGATKQSKTLPNNLFSVMRDKQRPDQSRLFMPEANHQTVVQIRQTVAIPSALCTTNTTPSRTGVMHNKMGHTLIGQSTSQGIPNRSPHMSNRCKTAEKQSSRSGTKSAYQPVDVPRQINRLEVDSFPTAPSPQKEPMPIMPSFNCRLVNRTQSWGGGLVFAGVKSQSAFDRDTHRKCYLPHCAQDQIFTPSYFNSSYQSKLPFKSGPLKPVDFIPRCHVYSTSNSNENLFIIRKSSNYMSMPNVNNNDCHVGFDNHTDGDEDDDDDDDDVVGSRGEDEENHRQLRHFLQPMRYIRPDPDYNEHQSVKQKTHHKPTQAKRPRITPKVMTNPTLNEHLLNYSLLNYQAPINIDYLNKINRQHYFMEDVMTQSDSTVAQSDDDDDGGSEDNETDIIGLMMVPGTNTPIRYDNTPINITNNNNNIDSNDNNNNNNNDGNNDESNNNHEEEVTDLDNSDQFSQDTPDESTTTSDEGIPAHPFEKDITQCKERNQRQRLFPNESYAIHLNRQLQLQLHNSQTTASGSSSNEQQSQQQQLGTDYVYEYEA